MPVCKKCGCAFPNRIVIDGKEHIVSSRNYCLECSPFGKHNTKKLEFDEKYNIIKRKQQVSNAVKRRRKVMKRKSIEYKGGRCGLCGYNKCESALEFHHIDPSSKLFGIGSGDTRSWESVREELDKCVLLCSNCHKEVESGMISPDLILEVFENQKVLGDSSMVERLPVKQDVVGSGPALPAKLET